MKTKQGICGLCFHSPGCGVIVHFDENGRIVRLEPDPQAPLGKVLCPIADSVSEVVYSEKRIKTPLKRVGPKGCYDFEPITWDEAYAIIADRLGAVKSRYRPGSSGFLTPVPARMNGPSRMPFSSRVPRSTWPPAFSFPLAPPIPLAWARPATPPWGFWRPN